MKIIYGQAFEQTVLIFIIIIIIPIPITIIIIIILTWGHFLIAF